MKKIYIAIVLCLLMCTNCTQNNGHIGPIFGSWTLMEMTEDGSVMADNKENTIFSFQNQIIQVTLLVDPPYTVEYRYGNFTLDDDMLTLKFQSKETSDSNLYIAPEWLHFPVDGKPIRLDIRKFKGNTMTLVMNSEGTEYSYFFKKTW